MDETPQPFQSPQQPLSEILERVSGRAQAAQEAFKAAGRPEVGPVAEELREAGQEWQETVTRARTWGTPTGAPVPFLQPRTCGHQTDRRCLACGQESCAECQAQEGPQACRFCHGPVYLKDTALPAGFRNPQMGDC